MFKKKYVTIIILLLLVLNFVFANPDDSSSSSGSETGDLDFGSDDGLNYEDTSDWDERDWNSADFSKIKNWGDVDQSKIPASRVGDIPADRVDVNAVQDQSKLTYDQLIYGDNFDQVEDHSKLDPAVRDKILAERAGKDVRSNTGGSSHITRTPTGFEIDRMGELDVGEEIKIRDGEGIKYDPPDLEVKKANSIEFMGISNEKVEDFKGNSDKKTYSVKKANNVQAGCFNVRDVQDTNFTLNGNIKVSTQNETDMRIVYGFRNEFKYTTKEGGNEIIANPRECFNPSYQIKGGNATFKGTDFEEIVEANNQTNITVDQDYGLECIYFTPIGTYMYKSDKIEKTFSLKAENEPHTVCLRKYSDQTYETNQPHFTMVDFMSKKLVMNGMITYKRFFYNYYADPVMLIAPNLMNHFQPTSGFSAVLRLNKDFLQATNAEVLNGNVKNRVTFSNFASVLDRGKRRYWELHPEEVEPAENLVLNYKTMDFPQVEVYKEVVSSGNVQVIPPDHPMYDTEFFIFSQSK